jgi:hypothetical protein
MALFEKVDTDTKAQRDAESTLRSRRRDRASLTERLGIAEAAITSFRAQARQLASEGADDEKITRAESRMRDSADRCVTLRGAIDDVDKIITGIEREIDQIVDRRCRRETSIAVDAMAGRLATAQAAHQAAALELEEAAKEGGLLIPESVAVHQFVLSMRTQLAPAVEMIVGALRQHAQGVLSGHAPASLPRPAAPAPKLAIVPPPPPTLSLIATKKLRYTDASGAVIVCGAYRQHTFPQALGELALQTDVAVALNDKRVRDFQAAGLATVGTPDEAGCAWWGPAGRELSQRSGKPGGPPIHSSLTSFTPSGDGPFTVVDRGGPITGTLPTQQFAVGARKLDDGE